MNKKKFMNFLHYHWQFYLLIVLLISFFYYGVYEISKIPSYDETICVFIESKSVIKEQLQERLNNNLQDKNIKKINIDNANRDDFYYSMTFSTRGLVNTDLLIISDDYLSSGSYKNYFMPLDYTILSNYISCDEYSYFIDNDDKPYGIQVNNYQQDVIEYDVNKNYYLFINKKSTKIGNLSLNSINDSAFIVISNFLKES